MTTLKLTFSNRELKGDYIKTSIDLKKEVSNRLTSICGKYYTIITSLGEMLEFKGKSSFDIWASKNEYVTDL